MTDAIMLLRSHLAALDEIERLGLHNANQTLEMDTLRTELARIKAELGEAVGLLSGLLAGKGELALDRLCKAQARSFLSRMEGRK